MRKYLKRFVFVLGAQDPEMVAIREFLSRTSETVVQATVGGKPVHGGNAYQAELPQPEPDTEYVLVECGPPKGHPLSVPDGLHPVYACQGGVRIRVLPRGGRIRG
jgi:hypothetical protein